MMAQSKSTGPQGELMIPFCKSTVGEEEIAEVTRVMRSGWMACGPETEAFENEFAAYVGAKHAIFTGSCTSALKIAYKWYREQGKDVVIYPDNTFCATYSAAREIDLEAYPRSENVKTDPDYVVLVNVHYGSVKDETPCLIEDSAHRIEPNDAFVGKIKTYSFYVTKNMTTVTGGMFVTNDDEIAAFARLCWKDGLTTSTADRMSGKVTDYEVKLMAGGYDADDVRAAIGRVQLRKLPEMTARRNAIRDIFNREFNQDWQGNHLYPFFVQSVDDVYRLRAHLKDQGIASGYHYPDTGWLGVSLPIFPDLTEQEQAQIIEAVRSFK